MDAHWRPEPALEGGISAEIEERILSAVTDERQRLSGELHDSIGGTLTGVAMGLNALRRSLSDEEARQKLAAMASAVTRGLEEIRTFSFALQTPTWDTRTPFDLVIARFATGFAQRAGLEINLEVTPASVDIAADRALVLIRVLQEALLNVHRHANATTITLRFGCDGEAATMTVQDDGCGMDLIEGEPPIGAGLSSMRDRIRRAGGVLRLESGRAGTTVVACIPLRRLL